MTLYQLKSFVTVAKLGSFTLAADRLQVRPPAVTLTVRSLQRELDVKLFERLGNKVHLTTAGQELLKEAQAVIAGAEGIKKKMEEVKGLKKGKISVGSAGIATPLILQAVHNFKIQLPRIEVTLMIQKSASLYQKLSNGELDVAIVGRPSPSPLILAEPYRDEEVVFFASAKHPLGRRRSVSLKYLAEETLVTFRDGHLADTVKQRFSELGLSFRPLMEIDLQLGGRETIKSAVESGLGVGFLTKLHILGDIRAGRITALNVPELKMKRTVYIAVHKNRRGSQLIQGFIDFLTHYKRSQAHLSHQQVPLS